MNVDIIGYHSILRLRWFFRCGRPLKRDHVRLKTRGRLKSIFILIIYEEDFGKTDWWIFGFFCVTKLTHFPTTWCVEIFFGHHLENRSIIQVRDPRRCGHILCSRVRYDDVEVSPSSRFPGQRFEASETLTAYEYRFIRHGCNARIRV